MLRFDDYSDEQIELLIGANYRGVIYGCQAALKQFREQGGGGVIENTASVAGMVGWARGFTGQQ